MIVKGEGETLFEKSGNSFFTFYQCCFIWISLVSQTKGKTMYRFSKSDL